MAYKKWLQGKYTPKFPDKYIGNVNDITYRSSWEFYFNHYLDTNPNIISWSSETLPIKYFNPVKNKITTYFPDYIVKYKNKHGEVIVEVIEIKPENQVFPPAKLTKQARLTFLVNREKWKACKVFCDNKGIKFRLLTEQQMFKMIPEEKTTDK
jgi:hypothetical protein